MNKDPILVGYDGSPSAISALHWAQEEAARRHAPVRLVYVYEWSSSVVPVPIGGGWPDATVRREALAAITEAAATAQAARPDVPLQGVLVDGPVISTLRKLSEPARLLVLGHRGLGGFAGLLAGSVAVGVATHADCPAVVVRGTAPPSAPVVVGVDQSGHTDPTIDFAFDQAAARGVDLVAVRAFQPPPVPWRRDTGPPSYISAALAAAEQEIVTQALHQWHDKYPQVTVRVRMIPANPTHALVVASAEAQLVVVGARGRGGFRGLRLGSVPRQLLHHAHCPVAVVRDHTDPA